MFRLAWRNLWRNKGRTAIIVSAISFSLAVMLIGYGITADRTTKMMASAVLAVGGNVLVHQQDYWADRTSDLQIVDGAGVQATLEGIPGVDVVIPRVLASALATSTHGAQGVQLQGIVPELEAHVYDYSKHLTAGEFLSADSDVDHPVVLGSGLVDKLELELGDRVVLTATGADGEVTRALFHVSGVIHTGNNAIDDAFALTTIDVARDALAMEQHVTQFGLLIADDEQRYEVRDRVTATLGQSFGTLEVLSWDQAMPDLLGYIEMDDKFALVYALVIFLVVAFGIGNTLMMMVMERIRELGMLTAIGMRPSRVLRMVMTETAALTLVAVSIGVSLALAGHLALKRYGIDMAQMAGGDVEVAGVSMSDTILRSQLNPGGWIIATLLVVLLIFAASLYPASRAARLDPVDAMRTY